MERHVNWNDMDNRPVFINDVLDNDRRKANVPNIPDIEETPLQNPILYVTKQC